MSKTLFLLFIARKNKYDLYARLYNYDDTINNFLFDGVIKQMFLNNHIVNFPIPKQFVAISALVPDATLLYGKRGVARPIRHCPALNALYSVVHKKQLISHKTLSNIIVDIQTKNSLPKILRKFIVCNNTNINRHEVQA